MNQQPWDFIVCTDRPQLGELSRVWRGAGHVARSAATIALVAPRSNDPGAAATEHHLGLQPSRNLDHSRFDLTDVVGANEGEAEIRGTAQTRARELGGIGKRIDRVR